MPRYGTSVISDNDLEKVAQRALTRPRNFIRYDREVFSTHGLVFAWADRGDDLIDESNYHVMLGELKTMIENGDAQPEDLIEGSESHWAVGHLSTLYVRVYENDCPCGEFTAIFKHAASMVLAIEAYPILDDEDHSQRESDAWDDVVNDALISAASDHCLDSEAEQVAFHTVLMWGSLDESEYPDLSDMFSHGDSSPDSVDWTEVERHYNRVRDDHFEWLARWHLYSPLAGQLAAF
jgi:hypothetical protein